jgi:hypothetical protein
MNCNFNDRTDKSVGLGISVSEIDQIMDRLTAMQVLVEMAGGGIAPYPSRKPVSPAVRAFWSEEQPKDRRLTVHPH